MRLNVGGKETVSDQITKAMNSTYFKFPTGTTLYVWIPYFFLLPTHYFCQDASHLRLLLHPVPSFPSFPFSFSFLHLFSDVVIGNSSHTPSQISENILHAIPLIIFFITKKWANVRSIGVKTSHSITIPVFPPITPSSSPSPSPSSSPSPAPSLKVEKSEEVAFGERIGGEEEEGEEEEEIVGKPEGLQPFFQENEIGRSSPSVTSSKKIPGKIQNLQKQQQKLEQMKQFIHYLENDDLTDDDEEEEGEGEEGEGEEEFYDKPKTRAQRTNKSGRKANEGLQTDEAPVVIGSAMHSKKKKALKKKEKRKRVREERDEEHEKDKLNKAKRRKISGGSTGNKRNRGIGGDDL